MKRNITKPETCNMDHEHLMSIVQNVGHMEHIKAICRMAMNTMNCAEAKIDGQTLYSAFALIDMLAGGQEDDLFHMEEMFSEKNKTMWPDQQEATQTAHHKRKDNEIKNTTGAEIQLNQFEKANFIPDAA